MFKEKIMSILQPSGFEIEYIKISSFSFQQYGSIDNDLDKQLALGHSMNASAKEIESNKYEIQVIVDLQCSQGDNKIFTITSNLIGLFNVTHISNDDDKRLLLQNMVAIIYSYLRPIVAQMSVMGKLPPLDLQPVNFTQFDIAINDR